MSTKPAASSRRTVAIGVAKWTGPSQPSPIVASDPLDGGDVADPAALGDEPAAGPQHRRQVGEQRVVVEDPVEGRGGQDRVDRARRAAADAPRSATTNSIRSPNGASRSRAASIIAARTVEGDDLAAREALRPAAR